MSENRPDREIIGLENIMSIKASIRKIIVEIFFYAYSLKNNIFF
jgi:hypothetical protein